MAAGPQEAALDTPATVKLLDVPLAGTVVMHPALSLVVLLRHQDGNTPVSAQESFSILDEHAFKQETGFTAANGWQLRPSVSPLWGGQPVERHLTLISQEVQALVKFYTSIYPHTDNGGFHLN